MSNKYKWGLGGLIVVIVASGIHRHLSSGSIYDLLNIVFVAIFLAFGVPAIVKKYGEKKKIGDLA